MNDPGTFTPCAPGASLLEAVSEAARNAASGGAVWLSPAYSSSDQNRTDQHRGEILCLPAESIHRGHGDGDPNMHGDVITTDHLNSNSKENRNQFASRFFEEEPEARTSSAIRTSQLMPNRPLT